MKRRGLRYAIDRRVRFLNRGNRIYTAARAPHDRGRDRPIPPVVAALLLLCCAAVPAAHAAEPTPGAEPSVREALVFPTEVFVITADELRGYNVHTLEDILELLPGVVYWLQGPRGAPGGYSIDGGSPRGITLLVNGTPFYDPYTFEEIARFLPLSRLERIEVIYGGSPLLTGSVSSGGAINFVMREGGEEGPLSAIDFTYGQNNRRARRVRFTTPRGRIGGAIAYDEYLQDAFESFVAVPTLRIGDYDSRSVLMELFMRTGTGDDVQVSLHRFEDSYLGTAYSAREDIRYEGFESRISYHRKGFSASLLQRSLSLSRRFVRSSTLLTSGSAAWEGRIGGVSARAFGAAHRTLVERTERGIYFDPSFHLVEGGLTAGAAAGGGVSWRAGVYGGRHGTAGSYLGGEAGLRRGEGKSFSQSLMVSRRLRVPSAQELFQPEIPGDTTFTVRIDATAGNEGLEVEKNDEIALGALAPGLFSLDLFARRERSRITLAGASPARYQSGGDATVLGARGRILRAGGLGGFRCSVGVGAEYFGKRSGYTAGIPRYRCLGRIEISHAVFKGTETASLRWDTEASGERSWDGVSLDGYVVSGVAASMTIMSATVTFQMRNIFDAEYETCPGYRMPERHYTIGVFWQFID